MKGCKFNDDKMLCTANGWLEDQDQEFFYNGIRTLENRCMDQVHFCRRELC